jgi:polyhydroxyalkanoate synthesis repressor PhaR
LLQCVNTKNAKLSATEGSCSVKPEKVVIRKYGNRRLYDTSTSKYINLEDIAALIRNGTDVEIVDAKSGADLTGATLTQIIAEGAKDKPSALPLELLRQMIITTDHAGQEFISWYLKSALDTYQQVQSSLKDRLSQVGAAALSPLQTMSNLLQGVTPEKVSPADKERELLQARLAELEARWEQAKKKSESKKASAAPPSTPKKATNRRTRKKKS